jgi:hypothetical protein
MPLETFKPKDLPFKVHVDTIQEGERAYPAERYFGENQVEITHLRAGDYAVSGREDGAAVYAIRSVKGNEVKAEITGFRLKLVGVITALDGFQITKA